MRLKRDFRLIGELEKNASELVREVAEERRTLAIMVDGEARAVLMDAESYDEWRSAVALLKIIAQGEADVAAGRLVSQDEAFERAMCAIELAENNGGS